MRKLVTAGWQTNAILVWNSGSPFTITDNFTAGQTVFNGSVGAAGPDRPNQIADPHVSNPSISEWFNRDAFVVPAAGQIGNAPRNGLFGPHFRHFDFSLFKDIALKESVKLQLRSEFFNLTNTPRFGYPDLAVGDETFGQVTTTASGSTPRRTQIGVRFQF